MNILGAVAYMDRRENLERIPGEQLRLLDGSSSEVIALDDMLAVRFFQES